MRIESHGIGHRPLADLELDEAAREIALSKLELEQRLGRPVRAFAYVKGSEAPLPPRPPEPAGPPGGLRARPPPRSRARTPPDTDPFQLHRYNVEPYPHRTFQLLVLEGACDLISLKDTVTGTHARRLFNVALGTATK